MAIVRPFKAYRSDRDKVHLVASRSYITYSRESLRLKLDENPFTFLHILNPEYKSEQRTKSMSKERFQNIKSKLDEFIEAGILTQDKKDSFYIYRQTKGEHSYTGIIGCASSEDYYKNVIKKHEATINRREEIFKDYLKVVEIHAEPVCLTYPNHSGIDQLTAEQMQYPPSYDFSTTNKVRHSLWEVREEHLVDQLIRYFGEISSIYIADGHHRSASSALMSKEMKEANPNHTGEELYNFFMGYFIPESDLRIYEFNRLVKTIGNLSNESFLDKVKEKFDLSLIKEGSFKPESLHEIGMYMEGKWYCLLPKKNLYKESNPVDSLDVSILSTHLLSPILGIEDLKTDERIYFKGGLEDIKILENEVDSGKAKIAFNHYPVSVEQMKKIADDDCIMPPKSTWIEPKLRSGLAVYAFNQD